VTIRPFVDEDLSELLDVWYRASLIAHSFLPEEFFERERREIAERWLPMAETAVYESDGRVVGFLSLIGNEVGAIFVDPDHQGRGIGRALMDGARALRPMLELGVFEANSIGRRFYDAYGFEFIGRRVNEATGQPELRLHLVLDSHDQCLDVDPRWLTSTSPAPSGGLPLFTIEQLDEIHDRLGTMESLADYVRALREVGVDRYESWIGDGHSEYFAADGRSVMSPAAHEVLPIADVGDPAAVVEHLRRHEVGETGYVEMSRSLAASGVEKWAVDTSAMTLTYLDRRGRALLVEEIGQRP
jgi:putative acetyltransferase